MMKSAGKRQANKKVNVLFNVVNIRTSFRRSLLFQPNGFHFKGIFFKWDFKEKFCMPKLLKFLRCILPKQF